MKLRITLLLFAAAMVLPLVPAPSAAQTPEMPLLNLEGKIALGEVKGRIDHMALDPLRSRLFVAELENNSLGIVDLKERKVVRVITGLTVETLVRLGCVNNNERRRALI